MKTKLILATLAVMCLLTQPVRAENSVAAPAAKTDASQFDKIDADKNGKISKEEWLAYQTEVFSKICPDGDSDITRAEWNEYQASKGSAR